MKRVIVTGATGFVGANLARRLLRDGHEVHLLVRPQYAAWRIEEIRAHVQLHEVNFLDVPALERTVSGIAADRVFHLAAHGAYSWQTDVARIMHTNFLATVNLVQACLKPGFEAFVNTGSSSEYGFKDHAPAENEWLEPNSYYAVGKAAATLFCRYTAQSRDANISTVRLYSAYGPYEDAGRLIPTLLVRGLEGEWPPLVNPDTARDYLYVDDASEAYVLAAAQPPAEPGPVYNVGTGVQTTLREVVALAGRLLAIEAQPQWGSMPGRQWDTSVWVADNRKISEELGWRWHTSVAEGMERTLAWLRGEPALLARYRERVQRAQASGREL